MVSKLYSIVCNNIKFYKRVRYKSFLNNIVLSDINLKYGDATLLYLIVLTQAWGSNMVTLQNILRT